MKKLDKFPISVLKDPYNSYMKLKNVASKSYSNYEGPYSSNRAKENRGRKCQDVRGLVMECKGLARIF